MMNKKKNTAAKTPNEPQLDTVQKASKKPKKKKQAVESSSLMAFMQNNEKTK